MGILVAPEEDWFDKTYLTMLLRKSIREHTDKNWDHAICFFTITIITSISSIKWKENTKSDEKRTGKQRIAVNSQQHSFLVRLSHPDWMIKSHQSLSDVAGIIKYCNSIYIVFRGLLRVRKTTKTVGYCIGTVRRITCCLKLPESMGDAHMGHWAVYGVLDPVSR